MSELENKAKPILLKLFNVQQLPELSKTKRRILALWATKTAFMLNRSSNYDQVVLDTEIRALNGGQSLPEHISVFLAVNPLPYEIDWLETVNWNYIIPDDQTMVRADGWRISLQIGRLCLIVAKPPDKRMKVVHCSNLHLPLIDSDTELPELRMMTADGSRSAREHHWRIVDAFKAVFPGYDGSEVAGSYTHKY